VVKRSAFVLFLLLIAVPTFAQDTYPRLQTAFGYANFSMPVTDPNTNRHNSGFTTQFDFNFTKNLGFDYYMGYYSLGSGTSLFSNLFGARLMMQGEKVSPMRLPFLSYTHSVQVPSSAIPPPGRCASTRWRRRFPRPAALAAPSFSGRSGSASRPRSSVTPFDGWRWPCNRSSNAESYC